MELPKYYTVLECKVALGKKINEATHELAKVEKEEKDYYKPYMVKTWFGYYKEVSRVKNLFFCQRSFLVSEYSKRLTRLKRNMRVLKSYPDTCKIRLTEVETLELFS